MKNPVVTIIIPCYNQSEYLNDTLQSVVNQTYDHWECIIVNDGSLDNTGLIAKKYAEKDNRFKYLFQENSGLSNARNLGLEKAAGNFIQFLDSDDYLDPRKIELSLKKIRENEMLGIEIILTNFKMFTDDINDSRKPYCELDLQLFNFQNILFKWDSVFSIPIHCGLFPAKSFSNFRFPEELKAKEDWIMWLHIFKENPKVHFIDKPLAYYRLHTNSMTKNSTFMEENYLRAIICIKNIAPQEDFFNFCFTEIQRKTHKIEKLKNSIRNYQNSRTYKYSQQLNKTWLGIFLHKIMKLKS